MTTPSVPFRSVWVTLIALPAVVVALLLTLCRMPGAVALTGWIRATWAGDAQLSGAPHAAWWLNALPLALATSIVSGYVLIGIAINVAYPLRPDAGAGDWGGPSLAGRWAVHAAGGVMFAAIAWWLLPALHRLAARILGRRDPASR